MDRRAQFFHYSLRKNGTAEYTGVVELKKSEYVCSCPFNPTPHYTRST